MHKSLRTFITEMEMRFPEEVIRVKKQVDPVNFDISALLYQLSQEGKIPITVFEKTKDVKGRPSKFPTAYNLFGSRKRCAAAIGHPVDDCKTALSLEFSKREQMGISPEVVSKESAPVKEVVRVGEEADLTIFPAARYHEWDIGPYFVMACVMRDNESGFYDVSFTKNLIKSPRKATISLLLPHLRRMYEANEAKGLDTRVAIVLGHHPAFYWGSLALTPFGNDDYETIGAFLQEPLRLTPSQTWGDDFLVPADAEIVIEGICPPKIREVQNPFGEISGHYQPQNLKPIVNVTAVTHRRDAILQGVFPGHEAHFNLGGIPKEGSIFNAIKKVTPDVTAVHLPYSGCSRMACYISIKKRREGDAKRVGLVPFVESGQMQFVVVVDDDIDVFNEREVVWSVITSTRATQDIEIIKNISSVHSWKEKILIDATRPLDVPFPKKIEVPKKALDRVKLAEYIQ